MPNYNSFIINFINKYFSQNYIHWTKQKLINNQILEKKEPSIRKLYFFTFTIFSRIEKFEFKFFFKSLLIEEIRRLRLTFERSHIDRFLANPPPNIRRWIILKIHSQTYVDPCTPHYARRIVKFMRRHQRNGRK